jgi:L-lactate dehydrogenase complex protein LldE
MRVGLAVPCYVDQFRPQAARATLTLLERLGCEVSLAFDAPCCGQPMFNAGVVDAAQAAGRGWTDASRAFDFIVMPSGSCTHHVRHHLASFVPGDASTHAARSTYELCEFIAGPLGITRLTGRFARRVALHLGCHAQRGLRLGGSTELHQEVGGPMHALLSGLDGLSFATLDRPDECCGFGGSFAIGEPEVSVSMGRDKIADATAHGAEVFVSSDPSCLLHLDGIVRHNATALRVMHVAELLEESTR